MQNNYKKAAFWYSKAAEKGDSRAQNSLGEMYLNGLGVEKDRNQAVYWISKAAEDLENIVAQNALKKLKQ